MKHICETLKDYIDAKITAMKGDTIFLSEELCKHIMKLQPERLNPENAIIPSYYGNKFCGGCKEENCVCESLTTTNK